MKSRYIELKIVLIQISDYYLLCFSLVPNTVRKTYSIFLRYNLVQNYDIGV